MFLQVYESNLPSVFEKKNDNLSEIYQLILLLMSIKKADNQKLEQDKNSNLIGKNSHKITLK